MPKTKTKKFRGKRTFGAGTHKNRREWVLSKRTPTWESVSWYDV